MGTNRLSDRLKSLEADGVIVKASLPPPGEAQVYVLTELGERLRQPVVSLAQWGAGLPLNERLDPSTARGVLLALVRCASVPRDLLPGIRETYDFTIADERFHIIVNQDRALPRSGPSPVSPDVTIDCDIQTLLMLDAGALTPARARRERNARIDGRTDAIRRAFTIMRRPT
jgi:hypothetical protein